MSVSTCCCTTGQHRVECDVPVTGKRKFGHSRDKRSDCVQVVIALIVTPDGFPLAYEVMPGNTSDKTTLAGFIKKIEAQYGKAQCTWVTGPKASRRRRSWPRCAPPKRRSTIWSARPRGA